MNLFHDDKGIQVMTDPPTSGTLSSGPFSFEPLSVNPKIMYTLSSVRTVVNLEASAKNVGQILARISNKGEVKEYQKDSSKGVSPLICSKSIVITTSMNLLLLKHFANEYDFIRNSNFPAMT